MSWQSQRQAEDTNSNLPVYVEILAPVMERIYKAVSGSNVEEGGKFLGHISQTGQRVNIEVKTYIDSGPNVDNSSGHLLPDSEYQYTMFEVIHRFESDIDYIGSWHTHHCNGLAELSQGDIKNYIETVNDTRYNGNYFFAFLVTGLQGNRVIKRCYLFIRGKTRPIEINSSQIEILSGYCFVEPILSLAEELSFQHRKKQPYKNNDGRAFSQTQHSQSQFNSAGDALQQIRNQDNQWILNKFPSAKAIRNKRDNCISWKWNIPVDYVDNFVTLDVCYKHPSFSASEPALLEISSEGEVLLSEKISLNSHRFSQIEECLKECCKGCQMTAILTGKSWLDFIKDLLLFRFNKK